MEFYHQFQSNSCGVSAVTGDGIDNFWKVVEHAASTDFADYIDDLRHRIEEQEAKKKQEQEKKKKEQEEKKRKEEAAAKAEPKKKGKKGKKGEQGNAALDDEGNAIIAMGNVGVQQLFR